MNGEKRHAIINDHEQEYAGQSRYMAQMDGKNAADETLYKNMEDTKADFTLNKSPANSSTGWVPPIFKPDMQVINLDYRYYQAFLGRYFYGHTPMTDLGGGCDGWAALLNPPDSGVNLFINYSSVSNNSDTYFRAEAWLNALPQGKVLISRLVANSNGAVNPSPCPHAELAFGEFINDRPFKGVSIYSLMVGAGGTASAEPYGKIIIPPGGTYYILLHAPESQKTITVEVAFGWWEERTVSTS